MYKKIAEIWIENNKDKMRLLNLFEKAGLTACYVDEYGSDGSEFIIMEVINDSDK